MHLTNLGDGRIVAYDPGALDIPPELPVERVAKAPRLGQIRNVRRKRQGLLPSGAANPHTLMCNEVPGYAEWFGRRQRQKNQYGSTHSSRMLGRSIGLKMANGKPMTRRVWLNRTRKAKIMAAQDLENIKKRVDLDETAQEALRGVLEVLRGPNSNKDKLAAANTLLLYTMTKPVQKSEVSISQAEAWLKTIEHDEDDQLGGPESDT